MKMMTTCPDCAAGMIDNLLVHEGTCPLGLNTDALCEMDEAWFEAHPGEVTYTRGITPFERAEFGGVGDYCTHVQVIRVRPGLRVRHPHGFMGGYNAAQVEWVRTRVGSAA